MSRHSPDAPDDGQYGRYWRFSKAGCRFPQSSQPAYRLSGALASLDFARTPWWAARSAREAGQQCEERVLLMPPYFRRRSVQRRLFRRLTRLGQVEGYRLHALFDDD